MLDAGRFGRAHAALVALGKRDGMLAAWLEGLEAKRQLFLDGNLDAMRQSVFTAKRRLDAAAVERLLKNEFEAKDRKAQGAAQDFLAEYRHFRDPVAEPLATRWALDALRELGAGDPDVHAGRAWLYERLRDEGVYRDHHWWADLVLATAYVEYLRAMTGGILGSDFTRAMQPEEQLTKLLGLKLHAYT
jgi:hypothetical protein